MTLHVNEMGNVDFCLNRDDQTDSAKNAIIRMAARQAVALLISSVQCRADAASGSVAR